MIESQFFEIDTKQDTVVEGKHGTVVVIPKGAFLDKKGKPVEDKVTVELAQPGSLSDLILSNLTTTSKGTPLRAAELLYVSAKSNGQPVTIDPANPLYMEVASDAEMEEGMLYYGERDEAGKMDWKDPQPLEKWLVPIELDLLNFYPPAYAEQVEMGMPFRHYTTATKELKDSLYYSMVPVAMELGVPKVEEGDTEYRHESSPYGCRIINPASIKALKDPKFQNTLISTREFEKRLQVIFETCEQKVLDLYVAQLDRNLWEVDSMAADLVGTSHPLYESFRSFSKERLTKVQHSGTARHLSDYYNKQVKKIEKELKETQEQYEKYLQKKDEEAARKRKKYQELLVKRQLYRLKKFGFKVSRSGYCMIDEVLKDLDTFELSVAVEKGNEYDRVHVYIVNPLIKSLFAMVSDSNTIFNRGYNEDRYLLMWKEQAAVAIVVAYKGEQPYYAVQDFMITKVIHLRLDPAPLSMSKLKDTLNLYRHYSKENKIMLDLEYQQFFFREQQRQLQLQKERDFMGNLHWTVFGKCCDEMVLKGKRIFEQNCTSCHSKNREKVGPALQDISKRRPNDWIIKFVHNSQQVIKSGDPYAVELYNRYNKTEMTSFPSLREEEIMTILAYLNCQSRN